MKNILIFTILGLLFSASISAQNNYYQIQKNEDLDSLSKKLMVSKESILKLNPDLDKNDLKDEIIVIPPREVEDKNDTASVVRFKEYKVRRKETLYSLAKENDISVEDIKKFNPYLKKEELGENDMIRIPIYKKDKINEEFNKSVQKSSFKNLSHIVLPKETKYRIAKKYNMDVDELDSLNPQVDELKPGQVLKVKNHPEDKEFDEDNFKFYDVEAKETLYSLSKDLEIPQDSLEALNPILKETGLQKGMELRIPKDNALAEEEEEEKALKAKTKLDLSDDLSYLKTKHIALMLPFNLPQFRKDSIDKENLLKNDQVLRISLDFYSGARAAIDSVEKLGMSIAPKFYDTRQNAAAVNRILKENNFSDTQLVIGPLLSGNIEKVSDFMKDKDDIAVLSPLTNDELHGSGNIFQTRPSKAMKERILISYLDSVYDDQNLLIVADEKHKKIKDTLMDKFPDSHLIEQEEEDYLQSGDIIPYLDKDRDNWVIMITDEYGVISNATSTLNARRHQYDIRLFTPDKNSIYDEEVNSDYLSHLHFTYSSVDKGDSAAEPDEFVKSYIDKYGITPNQYTIRGFDVTFDALLRLGADDDIFKSLKRAGYTEYVENRFQYDENESKGYSNQGVYLLQFEDGLKLKVLN